MAGEATRRRGETLLRVMWVPVFLFETYFLSRFCCGFPFEVEAQSFSGHRSNCPTAPMFVICEGVLSLLRATLEQTTRILVVAKQTNPQRGAPHSMLALDE